MRGPTGLELDQKVREILMAATRSNVLASAQALVALGFSGALAFHLVSDFIIEKERMG